jgi:hypothetical protein
MYSEVSNIFNRAERLWREVFTSENINLNAQNSENCAGDKASVKKRRNMGEEDFLWCWQHRGFW